MRKLFITTVCTALIFCACKEPSKKTNDLDKQIKELTSKNNGIGKDAGTYSIEALDGWTKTDTSISGMNFTLISSSPENEQDNFRDNLNVMTEKCGDATLDEYYAAALRNVKTSLNQFEEGKVTNRTINGMEFKYARYSHVYSGIPVEVDLYITIKNQVAYLLTCSSLKGDMEKYRDSFAKMVATFQVN